VTPVAGYSGTPLPRKLGIKEGQAVAFPGSPPDFAATLGELPPGVDIKKRAAGPLDVIVAFFTRRRDLERRFDSLARAIFPDGALWVAWPSRASGAHPDLTGEVVREVALPQGLVDIKVAAIDQTWSGLRLASRVENRR